MDNFLFDKATFSKHLVERRKACGYSSQQSFANAFNTRFRNGNNLDGNNPTSGILGTIKHYEDPNHKSMPRLDIVVEMCQLLDCDIDFLLGKIDKPKHIHEAMSQECGLSQKATDKLIYWKNSYFMGHKVDIVNFFLESTNFESALTHAEKISRIKPRLNGLRELLRKRNNEIFSQPPDESGAYNVPSGHNALHDQIAKDEKEYAAQRLYLNDCFTYIVKELEEKSLSKPNSNTTQEGI